MQALEDLYTHYDMTVRNASGGIVQFVYGDDGMDPLVMEGNKGEALDLKRMLGKASAGQGGGRWLCDQGGNGCVHGRARAGTRSCSMIHSLSLRWGGLR